MLGLPTSIELVLDTNGYRKEKVTAEYSEDYLQAALSPS